jgi:hypothetical protein
MRLKRKTFWFLALGFAVALLAGGAAQATTITLVSDAGTLGTSLGSGPPDTTVVTTLDAGNVSGLTFEPALVGAYGTFTSAPPGAPAGTSVINLAPGDGESGFFKVTFTLPGSFTSISLSGAANVDDAGRLFLNGTPLTPSLSSGTGISEFGNYAFLASDATLFHPGINVILLADDNSGGGPSGAAFYANVSYSAVPIPGALLLFGPGLAGLAAIRKRFKR